MDRFEPNLRIPGPTALPPTVREAIRAGYSSEHQLRGDDHILGGANERTGGAFYLIVTPKGQGSDVAIIANNGR